MNYLVFDTETGGLGNDSSLLTAWFGIYDEKFNELTSLDLKLKPDDGIYKVTGQGLGVNKIDLVIHDASATTYKEAKSLLYRFLRCNSYNGILIPVGHNVYFDTQRILADIISRGSWEQFVSYKQLDTMTIARFLEISGKLDVPDGISLSTLIAKFDIKVEGELHTASYDAKATIKVLQKLIGVINN